MANYKILIADDEVNIISLISLVLKQNPKFEIITAENGEVAIQKAIQFKPDLVITDIIMPKKTGFEVCRTLRSLKEFEYTPIIILSALGDEYSRINGIDEGADDYIIKPFKLDDLQNRIEELLERKKARETELEQEVQSKTRLNQNINENFIPTGYTDLDNQLYGGLPRASNILLIGKLGTGKSSFARSFIQRGLLANEKSLFVAIDDDPLRIREHLSQSLGDLKKFEEDTTLRFVDAYSWSAMTESQEAFYITGTLELAQLAGTIMDAGSELGQTVQEKKGGRRVFDSISSIFTSFELPSAQRFITQVARTAIPYGGVSSLFIIEEGTVDEKTLNNIKYIMDGIIELQSNRNQKMVRVAHMKWSRYQSSWVPFD